MWCLRGKFVSLSQNNQPDGLWLKIYTKLIPSIDVVCFEEVCRAPCIFVITDLMKMLNKWSRSTHFCSVIMNYWISGGSASYGLLPMRWLHRQCELDADRCSLHFLVGWFRTKLFENIFIIKHHISRTYYVL